MYHLSEVIYYESLPDPKEVEDQDELDHDIKDEKKDCCGFEPVAPLRPPSSSSHSTALLLQILHGVHRGLRGLDRASG